jgi:hypothetical protein
MATHSKMNKGTERMIANADIKHHIFPIPLFLSREEFMNSYRHGAKNIHIHLREQTDGTIRMSVRDDGKGDADVGRLKSPAESNGGGTSRYAAGLPITQLKRGNPEDIWSAAWKKPGEEEAMFMTNDRVETKVPIPFAKYHPWTNVKDHGFIHTTTLRQEKLQGVLLSDLLPILREIICASMRPETLKSLCIHILVEDKSGKVVASSKSTDTRDPWATLEDVLTGPQNKVVTKVLRCGDVVMTAKFVIANKQLYRETIKKATKGGQNRDTIIIPNFPNYGAVASPHAFLSQEGFVVADIPLDLALALTTHSSNYRYMFVDFSLDSSSNGPLTKEDVEKLPTPASTKTGYLQSCPIYVACMAHLRGNKPPGKDWLEWKATAAVHNGGAPPPNPKPVPPPKIEKTTHTAVAVSRLPALPPSPPPQVVVVPTVDLDIQWARDNQARIRKPAVLAELRALGVI